MSDVDERIAALRRRIDDADSRILELLNLRAEIVIEVGKAKAAQHLDFHVPQREEQIHAWYRIVTDALREHPDWLLVAKPHPLLRPRSRDCLLAREYLRSLPNRVVWLDPTEDIWAAIAAALPALSLLSLSPEESR